MAQQQQDVESLKRRGRRRLVGAVALALLAVIVLPMVFDQPRAPAPRVEIRIPAEEQPFKPAAGAVPAAPSLPQAPAVPPAPAPPGQYIVPVGAFTNPNAVTAKLSAAKIPHYTEAQGKLTRVRAGPFASREAAENAAQKLRGLGLEPGAVALRTG